jgi:hypothetical protein
MQRLNALTNKNVSKSLVYKMLGVPIGFLTTIMIIKYSDAYTFSLYTKSMLIISLINVYLINSTRKIIYRIKKINDESLSIGQILSLLIIPVLISYISSYYIIDLKNDEKILFFLLIISGVLFCVIGLYFQLRNLMVKYFINENLIRPLIFMICFFVIDINILLIAIFSFLSLVFYESVRNVKFDLNLKIHNYYKSESLAMISTIFINSIPSLLIIFEENNNDVIEMRVVTMLCGVLLLSQSVLHTVFFKDLVSVNKTKKELEYERKSFTLKSMSLAVPILILLLTIKISDLDQYLFNLELEVNYIICLVSIFLQISFGPVMLLLLRDDSSKIKIVNLITLTLIVGAYSLGFNFYIIFFISNLIPFLFFSLIWKHKVKSVTQEVVDKNV